ncbi:ATP-binding protein [Lentzea guizhouensis]|nr:ATP-binding protein [Lentzea guizhouensis]
MSHDVSNVNRGNVQSLVQAGVINGGVNFYGDGVQEPQDYSSMLEPSDVELLGREDELRRLREFCDGPDPYLWVRAESWSGKSALLREFARREHEGLFPVWYFVRRKHSDNRADFVRAVWHQLAGLLDSAAPANAPRDEHEFRKLLALAADRCEGTLVMIVDGLDEEAGEGSGSIVHLMPARPPAGLRVILSSRPQRPLPERVVESGHPLLSPDVVWELPTSEHATIMRVTAQEDLRALITGSALEKQLLGYVTAAKGALAVCDLAELLNVFNDEVDTVLEGLTGRSFARVHSLWRPGHFRYQLDHPSLEDDAAKRIGRRWLAELTAELLRWAHDWRDRGWPADTPEYLLLNHPQDDPVALALNPDRHVRLRALTGANAHALEEIAAARKELADGRDLGTLAQLAVLHDDLGGSTALFPPELPAVWAGLGHLEQAKSLIGELADHLRVSACAAVLGKVRDGAGGFREIAESALDRIGSPDALSAARAELAVALMKVGDLDAAQALVGQVAPEAVTALQDDLVRASWEHRDEARATALCDQATSIKRRARLVTTAALELSARSRYEEAADFVVARLDDEKRCGKALAEVVCDAAGRDPDQALAVLHRVKNSARYHKVKGDVEIAIALHRRDRVPEARERLELAERRISGKIDPTLYDGAVGEIVRAWVMLGEPDRAVGLGRSRRLASTRGRHLVTLVGHLVREGFPHQATRWPGTPRRPRRGLAQVPADRGLPGADQDRRRHRRLRSHLDHRQGTAANTAHRDHGRSHWPRPPASPPGPPRRAGRRHPDRCCAAPRSPTSPWRSPRTTTCPAHCAPSTSCATPSPRSMRSRRSPPPFRRRPRSSPRRRKPQPVPPRPSTPVPRSARPWPRHCCGSARTPTP